MTSKIIVLIAMIILIAPTRNAMCQEEAGSKTLFNIERRRDQFAKDFAYFIYPITGSVPGLGSAYGGGATIANIYETDIDFTGFYIKGDFEATGAALLNVHLLPERLIFNTAYYTAKVAPQHFRRGIMSDRDDFILPEFDSTVAVGQLTLTCFERMFEVYVRYAAGSSRLERVLDSDGNEFSNIDTSRKDFQTYNIGLTLDITADVQDPRKGIRLEVNRHTPLIDEPLTSKYDVYDYNLTAYLPMGKQSTWAFNVFFSDAVIRSPATTDREELKQRFGLQCDTISDPDEKANCETTEAQFLDEKVADNSFGTASALGGTQRLRSYPNGRFFAGVGSVADRVSDLHKNMRASYGLGFRVLFSSVTIRMDYATGDEGDEYQIFLDYPWSMFSVDNPA